MPGEYQRKESSRKREDQGQRSRGKVQARRNRELASAGGREKREGGRGWGVRSAGTSPARSELSERMTTFITPTTVIAGKLV